MFLFAAGVVLSGIQTQGFEAIPTYQGGGPVGLEPGGAGFAFSPQSEITVTALGCGNIEWDQEPGITVSLRDSNGLALASAIVTSSSPASNWANYQTIAPLTLTSNRTYFVSAAGTNDGALLCHALWASGSNSNGTFIVGPKIAYIGPAWGTNSNGTFPQQYSSTNILLIGPNFSYVTTTTILLTSLQMVGGHVQIGFTVSGNPASSFRLLDSAKPGGPWATNLGAVLTTNIPGHSYTFTTAPSGPVHFYRVQTP